MNFFIIILSCLPPVSLFSTSSVLWIVPISYASWVPQHNDMPVYSSHWRTSHCLTRHTLAFSVVVYFYISRDMLFFPNTCPLLWALSGELFMADNTLPPSLLLLPRKWLPGTTLPQPACIFLLLTKAIYIFKCFWKQFLFRRNLAISTTVHSI